MAVRPIDGDALKNQIRHMPRAINPDLVQYSLVQAIIADMPTLTPPNEAEKAIQQKPVQLYAWIYQHFARPGDKILDTHLGSGSSRIAAWDAGLDFVGCEIDKDYFEAQESRFAEHTAQLNLFLGEGG